MNFAIVDIASASTVDESVEEGNKLLLLGFLIKASHYYRVGQAEPSVWVAHCREMGGASLELRENIFQETFLRGGV